VKTDRIDKKETTHEKEVTAGDGLKRKKISRTCQGLERQAKVGLPPASSTRYH